MQARIVALLPLAVLLVSINQFPAVAGTTVDLQASVSAAGDDPIAMGATEPFTVAATNQGPDDASAVTVTFTATNGTIAPIDASAYDGVTCSTSADASTARCSDPSLTAGDDLSLEVDVTAAETSNASSESVGLQESVGSADTDSDPTSNVDQDSVTADRSVSAVVTHKFLYDPDRSAGQPADPQNAELEVFVAQADNGQTISGQSAEVYARKAGTTAWTDLGGVETGGSPGDSDSVYLSDLPAAPVDFRVVHDASLQAAQAEEDFTASPLATSIAASASATSLLYGHAVTIAGALTYGDPAVRIGYSGGMALEQAAVGTSDWTEVAHTTAANGTFRTTFKPSTTEQYRWRFPGDTFGAASTVSAPIEITLTQTIATALSPVAIPPGGAVTITASVRPGGGTATLQHLAGGQWQPVNAQPQTPDRPIWTLRIPVTGSFSYRVVTSGTSLLHAGTGRPVKVLVTRKGRGSPTAYTFLNTLNGHPASWNPCQIIHYRVNLSRAPREALSDVAETLRRIHLAGGLRFHYDGTTHEEPRSDWGGQRAELLVGWLTPQEAPILQGLDGYGGYQPGVTRHGHWVITRGYAMLNADSNSERAPGFGAGDSEGALLMHELGHAMGLGHTQGKYQIMNPWTFNLPAAMYGAGDLAGLHKLGLSQGCL